MSGEGKVTVIPDMATVSLGVSVERDTAKAAREAAAQQMTQVVAALKALGIADEDIATANVSLSPVYDYPTNAQPRIRGYQLQNTVTVTVRDLAKVSDVVDDTRPGRRDPGQRHQLRRQGPHRGRGQGPRRRRQGREGEGRCARGRARRDDLRRRLGRRVGRHADLVRPEHGAAAGAGDKAETPVLPGSTDVTITVQVTFLIP